MKEIDFNKKFEKAKSNISKYLLRKGHIPPPVFFTENQEKLFREYFFKLLTKNQKKKTPLKTSVPRKYQSSGSRG